jgi:hypothetical protein
MSIQFGGYRENPNNLPARRMFILIRFAPSPNDPSVDARAATDRHRPDYTVAIVVTLHLATGSLVHGQTPCEVHSAVSKSSWSA